jgi:hypothetical protein
MDKFPETYLRCILHKDQTDIGGGIKINTITATVQLSDPDAAAKLVKDYDNYFIWGTNLKAVLPLF